MAWRGAPTRPAEAAAIGAALPTSASFASTTSKRVAATYFFLASKRYAAAESSRAGEKRRWPKNHQCQVTSTAYICTWMRIGCQVCRFAKPILQTIGAHAFSSCQNFVLTKSICQPLGDARTMKPSMRLCFMDYE